MFKVELYSSSSFLIIKIYILMSWLVNPTIERILLIAQSNHILCTLQGPFRKTVIQV